MLLFITTRFNSPTLTHASPRPTTNLQYPPSPLNHAETRNPGTNTPTVLWVSPGLGFVILDVTNPGAGSCVAG